MAKKQSTVKMPPKGMHKMPGGHMMKDSEMKKMMKGGKKGKMGKY